MLEFFTQLRNHYIHSYYIEFNILVLRNYNIDVIFVGVYRSYKTFVCMLW